MRTRHGQLQAGQNIYSALAYSDDDVLNIGAEFDITGYKNNPVILSEHDPKLPVGQATAIRRTAKGIRIELAFDTGSAEGIEAERKWRSGLRSSLSIGVNGIRDKSAGPNTVVAGGHDRHKLGKRKWALVEISQVSVPLDQRATATPSERGPIRVASSLNHLADLEDQEGVREDEDLFVILKASAATQSELEPAAVHNEDVEDADKDVENPDEKDSVTDSDNEVEEKEEEENQSQKSNSSNMDIKNSQELTDVIDDLKSTNRQLRQELDELKDTVAKKEAALNGLQKEKASLTADLTAERERKRLDPDDVVKASQDIADREAKLQEQQAELERKEARVAVDTEIARWRDLLPDGFSGRQCSVRDVLEAACPNNLLESDMSDDVIRGLLINEKKTRFNARIVPKTETRKAHANGYPGGYISAVQLQEMETNN